MRLSRGGKAGDRPRTAPNAEPTPPTPVEPAADLDVAPTSPSKTKRFRAPFGQPRLSAEAAMRQGQVVKLALGAFPAAAAATAFLNADHAELGGRPIDLAVASDAGLAAVAATLAERRAR